MAFQVAFKLVKLAFCMKIIGVERESKFEAIKINFINFADR